MLRMIRPRRSIVDVSGNVDATRSKTGLFEPIKISTGIYMTPQTIEKKARIIEDRTIMLYDDYRDESVDNQINVSIKQA